MRGFLLNTAKHIKTPLYIYIKNKILFFFNFKSKKLKKCCYAVLFCVNRNKINTFENTAFLYFTVFLLFSCIVCFIGFYFVVLIL